MDDDVSPTMTNVGPAEQVPERSQQQEESSSSYTNGKDALFETPPPPSASQSVPTKKKRKSSKKRTTEMEDIVLRLSALEKGTKLSSSIAREESSSYDNDFSNSETDLFLQEENIITTTTNNNNSTHEQSLSSLSQRKRKKKKNNNSSSSINSKDEQVSLAQDSFSFLVATRPGSVPFFSSLVVVLVKQIILAIVFWDLFQPDQEFDIPALVALPVVLAEVISLVLSVFTQNDLISSVMAIYHGYHDTLPQVFPQGGLYWQWILSIVLNFVDGIVGLTITFLLIITSDSALNVILNFAAVSFVSGLDEVAFYLAQLGLLGRANRMAAEAVANRTFARPKHGPLQTPFVQIGVMLFILAILLGFWIWVFVMQKQGEFVSQTLFVQFDDAITPELAAHSGFYSLSKSRVSIRSGFLYTEDRNGNGRIGYCPDRRRWTFFVGSSNACDNINVESTLTDSFNVLDTTSQDWFVRSRDLVNTVPMKNFYLSAGCQDDEDCGNNQGNCQDNRCVCHPGYLGIRCTYQSNDICGALQLNELFGTTFPTLRSVTTSYNVYTKKEEGEETLETCYGRPIYVNNQTDDVAFFTGLRWTISNANLVFGSGSTTTPGVDNTKQVLERMLSPQFHSGEVVNVDLVSDPVPFRTQADIEVSPVELPWFAVTESANGEPHLTATSQHIEFLCSQCNSTRNPCFYQGICEADESCTCQNRASGSLCEVPPTSDGVCDSFFNDGSFSYDGGDCCLQTCQNTPDSTCGIIENQNGVQLVDLGFNSCVDPVVVNKCAENGNSTSCFLSTAKISPSTPTRPRPMLSANGRFLAISETTLSTIRVYELKGSDWVQLGNSLKPPKADYVGEALAIVSQTGEIVGTRESAPQLYVAALWYPDVNEPGTVTIYRYSFDRVGLFENWGEIAYTDYPGYTGARGSLQRTGLLTIGFREPCVFCSRNPLSILLNTFDSFDAEGQRLDMYHLHYRDSRSCNTGLTDQVCGDSSTSFELAFSGSASAAALSGDGKYFAKVPPSGGSLEFYAYPFYDRDFPLALTYQWGNFRFQSIGLAGQIRGMKLSHYGNRLTVVTDEKIHYYVVNVYNVDENADLLIVPTVELVSRSTFDDFALPKIDGVRFSAGGSSLAVFNLPNVTNPSDVKDDQVIAQLDYQILSVDRFGKWKNHGTFTKSEASNSFLYEDFPSLSLSDDGHEIAFTTNDFTQVQMLALKSNCNEDEYIFRLSITGAKAMDLTSWSLARVQFSDRLGKFVLDNSETNRYSCSWCYRGIGDFETSELDRYDNRVIAEEFCVPKDSWSCSRFFMIMNTQESTDQLGTGFAAYQIDGPSTSLVASATTMDWPGYSKLMSDGSNCSQVQELTCGESEELFSLLLPLNYNPASLRWDLSSDSVFIDAQYAEYTDYPPGQLVWEQRCLSRGVCYTLQITKFNCKPEQTQCPPHDTIILTESEDILPTSENYTVYWNQDPLFSGTLNLRSSVTESFGDC